MANLREENKWEAGIYQLETTDPVVGGVDGISNKQAIQLANRTGYLKGEVETLKSDANAKLASKRDVSDSYSKTQTAALLAPKLDAVVAEAAYMKKTDASSFLQTTQGRLISEYAHVTHSQILPDGDYSSSDFWLSVKPGIYYAVREKGRNKPAAYGLVEIISNGEISVTWSYFGEVWKWYQGFNKSTLGWKKVVFGDVTPEARANSIVARNANGDFDGRYVNAEYFRMTNSTQNDTFTADCDIVYRINDSSDAYLRSAKLSKVASLLGGLGVRQTWQDVLSQRKFNVVYTNTTDKPIFVSIVSYPTPTPTAYVSFYIDGLLVARSETSGINDNSQITAVVPSGSTYKMDNGGDNGTRLKAWAELR